MNHNVKNEDPIKQHYLAKWFLSLFTDPNGKLYVYDVHNSKEYKRNPSKAGYANNFQTLTAEYENLDDPYILEKETGKQLEEPASKILKTIIKTKKIPPINEFSYVLSFAAVIGRRNQIMKQEFIKIRNQNESTCNQTDDDEIIKKMLNLASNTTDQLLQKNWMLVETNTSNFYCSDFPLESTTFDNNSQIDTIFFFPLSSKFALIGASSTLNPYKLIDHNDVACINHFTALNASKIYSNQKITISNKTKSDLYAFLKGIIKDI
jgi:hypothetical protein